jgi:uncharacterized protein (DUF433 family)/transposase-like protein
MTDFRTTPLYPVSEAARIAHVSASTLRYWFPKHARDGLNFLELVEAYTIQTLRSRHQLALGAIRKARQYLRKQTGEQYPLALQGLGFETDGSALFITHLGKLVSATEHGQMAMRDILTSFLKRVEHGADGLATRFYPFTRDFKIDSPQLIVVDPRLNFGRPCLASRAISTSMIARRYKAGETVAQLADDYGCRCEEIEEALRAELELAA